MGVAAGRLHDRRRARRAVRGCCPPSRGRKFGQVETIAITVSYTEPMQTQRSAAEAERRPDVARPWAKFARALALAVALALAWGLPASVSAQTNFPSGQGGGGLAGTLFSTESSLFPEDGRIKLLVIALNPFGLTESAAEQIGLILEKDLTNTGHFGVVGPREANAYFEKERPELVDCRAIACGVESGKRLGAQKVLVGSISMAGQNFELTIRLIDTLNNTTDHEEEILFTDETMDEDLFRLANSISRNSLLTGRVLSTSIRGIVIGLGKRHGIKIGDRMVVFKQEVPITNLEGQNIDTQRKSIAIVKVLNVNENSSEAIIAHSTEEPQVSHFAQTYLSPTRQIELVENTRRELDTGIRLENKIRPLTLAPVLLADSERKKWRQRMFEAERDRNIWFTVGLAAGAATVYFLQDFSDSDIDRLRTFAAIGTTAYAMTRYVRSRNEINDLEVEGRAKGYTTSFDYHLELGPGLVGVAFDYRF